ncbi:MAG TPA: ATP-binding protein [Candidatus Acidoferrum sp.]|nr:ATP-binding protein [Candidatus Acidoferrum sp.]
MAEFFLVHLSSKLTLWLLVAVAVVMSGFGYIRVQEERRWLIADLQQDVWVQANTIKLTIERALREQRLQAIQELLAEIERETEPVDRIRVLDRQLVEVSSAFSQLAAEKIPQADLEQVVKSGQPISRYLDLSPHPVAYVILPLRSPDGSIIGALEILHLATRIQQRIQGAAWDQVVRLTLLSLTVAVVIFLTVQISVRRPVGELVEIALAFGRGDLSLRHNLRRRDEIGQLSSAFDQMAESLQTARAQIKAEGQNRLELERQLQQVQKLAAVGKLASEVAHEISTPLNIVSGRAEVIQKEVEPEHPLSHHATIILRQVERIGGMVRQLLDYSRPRHPAFGSVDANSTVLRILELVEPLAALRQIRLHAEVPEDLPPLLADPDQLQQVLLNLVTNSLDATPPGGEIRLAASRSEPTTPDPRPRVSRGRPETPYLTLMVSDTGGGMSRHNLEQIFEPFFSTKERKGGTGLGIPIAEDIVRSHRGAIEVRSAEGGGTMVLLRWPIAVRGASPNSTRNESSKSTA